MNQDEINQNLGVIDDPRTQEEKDLDWQHEELYAAGSIAAPVWEERAPKQYPIFNQDGSSGCVSFATAKILGIDEVVEGREFVHLSPRDIYTRRANQGQEGMYFPNALSIATKHGATLESLVPSEGKNEVGMNDTSDITPDTDAIASKYRSAGYLELKVDIDVIASILAQGKAVLLGTRFDYDEWTTDPVINPNSKKTLGHGIAATDFILRNGEKVLVIEDSWGYNTADNGKRYLSEEWVNERVFYAGYTKNLFLTPNVTTKPIHTFTNWMKKGDKNDDVAALQDILKYEGMFPLDTDSTGLYGAITQAGVLKFQMKYLNVNNGGKQVGPQTMAKLNELYSK